MQLRRAMAILLNKFESRGREGSGDGQWPAHRRPSSLGQVLAEEFQVLPRYPMLRSGRALEEYAMRRWMPVVGVMALLLSGCAAGTAVRPNSVGRVVDWLGDPYKVTGTVPVRDVGRTLGTVALAGASPDRP